MPPIKSLNASGAQPRGTACTAECGTTALGRGDGGSTQDALCLAEHGDSGTHPTSSSLAECVQVGLAAQTVGSNAVMLQVGDGPGDRCVPGPHTDTGSASERVTSPRQRLGCKARCGTRRSTSSWHSGGPAARHMLGAGAGCAAWCCAKGAGQLGACGPARSAEQAVPSLIWSELPCHTDGSLSVSLARCGPFADVVTSPWLHCPVAVPPNVMPVTSPDAVSGSCGCCAAVPSGRRSECGTLFSHVRAVRRAFDCTCLRSAHITRIGSDAPTTVWRLCSVAIAATASACVAIVTSPELQLWP
eukprot:363864-Chlamydomonas_euryale.AAC.23